jgi:hypothetical protein
MIIILIVSGIMSNMGHSSQPNPNQTPSLEIRKFADVQSRVESRIGESEIRK